MRERIVNLNTPEDVQGFLQENPTSVVFKAGTCHKTMQGFGFLQEQLERMSDLKVGIIRVVEARPASNLVTETTGIRHESPQVILFQDGQPVFEVNNWNITPDTLGAGLGRLPQQGQNAAQNVPRSDLKPYLDVLGQYLSGVMSDEQFEYVYPTMFRDDASLRSRDEVEVLNSIFGDVDQHMTMHAMMAGRSKDYSVMRQRAERAYERLQDLARQTA